MNDFSQLGLIEPLQRAVHDAGYKVPTPIQAQAIPSIVEGRDLLGCARTGTGKTAAFALPMLQRLTGGGKRAASHSVRALVLVPTRELAAQVAESFRTYGRGVHATVAVVYGGVGQGPQVRALARGVDVLVATPGRLVDLMEQGHARLDRVETLVLDEADHMLDLGFLPDVRRILSKLPARRQTLFFSATMPAPISELADRILTRPVKVMVTPPASTVEATEQRVHFVSRAQKVEALARLLSDKAVERALVFTRTKRGADRVARRLVEGGIPAQAIHGNKSQGNRERTLEGFRGGRVRVLVATDIAARGIDVDGITHVINFELPNVPEAYVHRIGRTGRAGASGVAISLCDPEEREFLRDIEKLTRHALRVMPGPNGAHESRAIARGAPPPVEAHRPPARHGHPARPTKRAPRDARRPHAAPPHRGPRPVSSSRSHPTGSRPSHAKGSAHHFGAGLGG